MTDENNVQAEVRGVNNGRGQGPPLSPEMMAFIEDFCRRHLENQLGGPPPQPAFAAQANVPREAAGVNAPLGAGAGARLPQGAGRAASGDRMAQGAGGADVPPGAGGADMPPGAAGAEMPEGAGVNGRVEVPPALAAPGGVMDQILEELRLQREERERAAAEKLKGKNRRNFWKRGRGGRGGRNGRGGRGGRGGGGFGAGQIDLGNHRGYLLL